MNSSRFFENRDCEYFPCHRGLLEFNCLFCYCPLYFAQHCPGNPVYIKTNTGKVKDCSFCAVPHKPDNYDLILEYLQKTMQME